MRASIPNCGRVFGALFLTMATTFILSARHTRRCPSSSDPEHKARSSSSTSANQPLLLSALVVFVRLSVGGSGGGVVTFTFTFGGGD